MCSIIYIIELFLKVVALGYRKWVVDRYNWLDLFCVVMMIVELAVGDSFGAASLRALRMLRFFRLARGWKDLQVTNIPFKLTKYPI